jgi:hypothetical protein
MILLLSLLPCGYLQSSALASERQLAPALNLKEAKSLSHNNERLHNDLPPFPPRRPDFSNKHNSSLSQKTVVIVPLPPVRQAPFSSKTRSKDEAPSTEFPVADLSTLDSTDKNTPISKEDVSTNPLQKLAAVPERFEAEILFAKGINLLHGGDEQLLVQVVKRSTGASNFTIHLFGGSSISEKASARQEALSRVVAVYQYLVSSGVPSSSIAVKPVSNDDSRDAVVIYLEASKT